MNTTIINILGAPGVGKSTLAADLYAQYSKEGRSVELVREWIKESHVWPGRNITPFDQIHAVASQMHRESSLFGKVDCIITDSPVILGLYYLEREQNVPYFKDFVGGYESLCKRFSVEHSYYLLDHPKRASQARQYVQEGRLHSEGESSRIGADLTNFLENYKVDYVLIKDVGDIHD